ncbi:MAG: response regulator [Burkholderiales bacterium]|jgi:twitching motility two-component system response regulator PilH|nr:response regulator [Burkholderiales bacterium]
MAKVLVVDDSPTERHVLETMLVEAGFQVFQSDSGEMGIEQAKLIKPDIILMDVVMPGLGGFQACRKLKTDTATQNIPVVMCTTKNQPTDKIWGMRQGASGYLTKPIERKSLLATIQECLAKGQV